MSLSRRSKAAIVVTVLLVGVGAFANPSHTLMTYANDRAVDNLGTISRISGLFT